MANYSELLNDAIKAPHDYLYDNCNDIDFVDVSRNVYAYQAGALKVHLAGALDILENRGIDTDILTYTIKVIEESAMEYAKEQIEKQKEALTPA